MGEDFGNQARIAKLLRFASTHNTDATQNVSLTDYIARMQEGQSKIYYVTADTYQAARHSPHLEVFRKKGVEVLLLSDRVDEWMLSNLREFDGKEWQSVARGGLDLGALEDEAEKTAQEKTSQAMQPLVDRMKSVLASRAKDVRITHRLTDSPSCLVSDDGDMSGYLQRLLKQAGQQAPTSHPILEINPTHVLVQKLQAMSEDALFSDWAHILFDQAVLAEGGTLDDPAAFVRRVNLQLGTV